MTENEFDILTDKLKGRIKYLYFHLMGEPTLHPNLSEFISQAKKKGFLPIITTNGSLLGTKGSVLLSEPPHKVSISLHAPGANPAFSDESYFYNCINFAKNAAEKGCYTALRLWNLNSAREKDNDNILSLLKTEFPQPWQSIRNGNGKRLDDKIYLEFAETFDWPDLDANECPTDANVFCYGLRDQIGILCDGTVVPCCLDAEGIISLGNLFESDLDTILDSPRAKAIYDGFSRRIATEELCRKCGYAKRFTKYQRKKDV